MESLYAQCLACGARPERRAFHVQTVLGHSSLLDPAPVCLERGPSQIEVDVVCLDDVLPIGAQVDVVKIDVEGAELDVLAGMARILRDGGRRCRAGLTWRKIRAMPVLIKT